MEDDLFYLQDYAPRCHEVIEPDPHEPIDTGILDHKGNPIIKVPTPKPPIGFHNPAHLYDHDPDEDYFYVCEPI